MDKPPARQAVTYVLRIGEAKKNGTSANRNYDIKLLRPTEITP